MTAATNPTTTAEQITAAPAGFPSDAYRAGEAVVVPFSGRNLRVRGWQHAVWFGEPTYVTIKEFGALNVRAGSSLYTRTPDGYEEWQEQMDRDAAQREKRNMADHPETTEAARRLRSAAKKSRRGPQAGKQIRSYVLAPQRFAKDERTGFVHPDPEAVLDGDLDAFMREALTRG